jgi:hypothetical protein
MPRALAPTPIERNSLLYLGAETALEVMKEKKVNDEKKTPQHLSAN